MRLTEIVTDIVGEARLRASYRKHAALAQILREVPAMAFDEWTAQVDGARVSFSAVTAGGGHVAADLTSDADVLPTVDRLIQTPEPSDTGSAPANRIRSLVHYFLALVENPARDAEPFFELLAPAYALHYPAEPITDAAALRAWVAGPLSSVIASEHVIHSVASEHDGEHWSARVSMTSQALFPDGSGAISRNTQAWRGTDDPADRFPRIAEILIDRDAVVFFDPEGRRTR